NDPVVEGRVGSNIIYRIIWLMSGLGVGTACLGIGLGIAVAVAGCEDRYRARSAGDAANGRVAAMAASNPVLVRPISAAGIDNFFQLSDQVYSGSEPHGDAGFESLAKRHVRTIISVDGATPDNARANARGIRYVHIPIGYDGIPDQKGLELLYAMKHVEGPV